MAIKKQLVILKKGSKTWNGWRKDNPDERIDLSEADLSDANLGGTDLRQADLSDVNLRGTDLIGAKLIGAKLRGADLSWADLIGADLSWTDLREADLSRAKLIGAKLRGAKLDKTIFASRTELGDLKFSLAEEQQAGSIFIDEREEEKKKKESVDLKTLPYLSIEFQDDVSWKNEWLAFWLISFQITYNNLFYLSSTDETDVEIIKDKLVRNCQVGARDDIELQRIQRLSPLILQYVQYAVEHAPQVTAVLAAVAALITAITKGYKSVMDGEKSRKEGFKIEAETAKLKVETEEKKIAPALEKKKSVPEGIIENIKKELEPIEISTSNKVILDNKAELLFLASKKYQITINALKETANIWKISAKMLEE